MKTQISYRKLDGSTGMVLVDGAVDDVLEAKHEIANDLDLPTHDTPDGHHEDIDHRLRHGGVEPSSVSTSPVSE